jgi:hypothetical protein
MVPGFAERVNVAVGRDVAKPGLQALGAHAKLIDSASPRSLVGSVDLDAAVRAEFPREPRWDYGLGVKQSSGLKAVWVEVHRATDGDVAAVIKKARWLKTWLSKSPGTLKQLPAELIWIADGRVGLSPKSPKRALLAQEGVKFRGSRLRIDASGRID